MKQKNNLSIPNEFCFINCYR